MCKGRGLRYPFEAQFTPVRFPDPRFELFFVLRLKVDFSRRLGVMRAAIRRFYSVSNTSYV